MHDDIDALRFYCALITTPHTGIRLLWSVFGIYIDYNMINFINDIYPVLLYAAQAVKLIGLASYTYRADGKTDGWISVQSQL